MEKFKKTFSLRKKKTPDDLNLLKPQQWQEDERKVREGTCSFQVKYLGHLEVFESRGMQVCEEALKALRKTKVTKGQRAILYVSGDALRVTDEISKGLIVDQTIDKVSFCAPDRNHERGFAYICRDGTTRRWICHGFLAVKESGERLSHAVGCAFAICLEKKQKREKESVHITYNDDKTSFTRHGSFRPASLMERIQDPQSVIIAEPPPSNNAGDQSSSSSSNNVISSSGHLRSRSSVREPSSALGQIPESSNESFSVSSTNSKKPTTTTPSGNKSNNAAAKELDESHDSRSKRDNSNIHFEHENATMSGGGTGNNNGGAASSSVSSTQATHAIPRPHASTTVFDRQRSLRLFPKLNETTSPFKREFSLRLEELPSNLSRSHPACKTIPEDDSNNSMNDSFFTSQFAFSNAIPEQTALPVFAASSNSLQVTFPSSWDAAAATAASPSFMMKSHNSGMTDPFSSAPVNSTALQQALFGGGGAGGTGGGFADLGAEFSASSHYATQHSGSSPVPPPPPAMPPPPAAFASAHAPTNPFPVITPFGLSQFSGGETAGNNSFNSPFTNATNNFSPRNPWCRDMENVSSASCIATAGPKDPFDVDWIEKEKFFSGFGNSNMLSSPPALLRSTSAVVSTNPFLNYS